MSFECGEKRVTEKGPLSEIRCQIRLGYQQLASVFFNGYHSRLLQSWTGGTGTPTFSRRVFPAYSLWYRPRFCNSDTTFDETYGGATEKIEAMGIVYPFYWSIIPSASRYCYVMIKRVFSLPLFAIKSF